MNNQTAANPHTQTTTDIELCLFKTDQDERSDPVFFTSALIFSFASANSGSCYESVVQSEQREKL
jgi:hypothetical protein